MLSTLESPETLINSSPEARESSLLYNMAAPSGSPIVQRGEGGGGGSGLGRRVCYMFKVLFETIGLIRIVTVTPM